MYQSFIISHRHHDLACDLNLWLHTAKKKKKKKKKLNAKLILSLLFHLLSTKIHMVSVNNLIFIFYGGICIIYVIEIFNISNDY